MVLCGGFLTSCEQPANNSRLEQVKKRSIQGEAMLGLSFFYGLLESDKSKEELIEKLRNFAKLHKSSDPLESVYEFGALIDKESLSTSWLCRKPVEECLVWENFEKLQKLCPECEPTGESFAILAISNLDDDEELDVWSLDESRTVVHLSAD